MRFNPVWRRLDANSRNAITLLFILYRLKTLAQQNGQMDE
jgi:hypothetical protein